MKTDSQNDGGGSWEFTKGSVNSMLLPTTDTI